MEGNNYLYKNFFLCSKLYFVIAKNCNICYLTATFYLLFVIKKYKSILFFIIEVIESEISPLSDLLVDHTLSVYNTITTQVRP